MTTIVDVFNIIYKIRGTCIHLKVDKEQWRVAQGSKREVGYGPRVDRADIGNGGASDGQKSD